jgi:hypothetical protein
MANNKRPIKEVADAYEKQMIPFILAPEPEKENWHNKEAAHLA